jgi:hypothetical protein
MKEEQGRVHLETAMSEKGGEAACQLCVVLIRSRIDLAVAELRKDETQSYSEGHQGCVELEPNFDFSR